MKRKYQIFISSTYSDLLEERQAAVQAILRAGHIPAGMELFSAGDKSQLETIKKWIQESDIYILILGGRYGSIEPESQLSYTEVEYRYALELGKPFFALVMDNKMLHAKTTAVGQSVLELENRTKYKEFKDLVLTKVCRIFSDLNEIKLSILESIIDIQNQYTLTGWIKGDEIQENTQLLTLIADLRNEKEDLQKEIKDLESLSQKHSRSRTVGEYTYEEIKKVLESKPVTLPSTYTTTGKDMETNMLKLLYVFRTQMANGVSISFSNDLQVYLCKNLVPILLNFGLVDRVKSKRGTNFEIEKFILSALGNKFLSLLELSSLKK